ncbi:MAG: arsenate reductase ArsC [Pseudomonadota bacterium]
MAGVLFACVANSARSQLAEAIARHLAHGAHDFWSAGSQPSHVKPEVRAVLDEVGIHARGLRAKGFAALPWEEIHLVVSLCAEEVCPVLPGAQRRQAWPLPDPAAAPDDERLEAYRAARDELLRRIPQLLAALDGVA